jgi:hypothetical protein
MSDKRKTVVLFGVSVTDKSLLCSVNASDNFSLYAAFLLLFVLSPSKECNSKSTSSSINFPNT